MISVILVTWNSGNCIKKCIKSILSSSNVSNLEIVIIDNNSTDDTREIIKANFTSVAVIENEQNMKLSKALNQGFKFDEAEYYLVLNPDVELNKITIEKLVTFIESDKRIGIVAPRLMYPSGSLQYSARTFPSLKTIFTRGIGITENRKKFPGYLRKHLMMDSDHNKAIDVDWVLGACFLARGDMLKRLGYIDERYPMYYGDVDLCWRARKKGWRVVCVPQATAIHDYQRSSAHGSVFNTLRWSHFVSAMRFLIRKRFI